MARKWRELYGRIPAERRAKIEARLKRVSHVQVYRGRDKRWYVRRKAGNGRITATAGQGYASTQGARRAAKRLFPDLGVLTVR